MTWRIYDETIPANGIEPSRLLQELRVSFGDARVTSVNGPWAARPVGSQVWIDFEPDLAGGEIATAAGIYAAHDGSLPPAGSLPITYVDADHELGEVAHECSVDASVQMITMTLPLFDSAPSGVFVLKVSGANGMTIVPNPDDIGMTIDGAASLVVADGGAVRIGASNIGEWVNVNS